MRTARIYMPEQLSEGTTMDLDSGAVRHLGQVLRRRSGDSLIVFDGAGTEHSAVIRHISKNRVTVELGARLETNMESPLELTLWHGLCRGGRMDSVIQKATELGVKHIQPVLTERGVVKLDTQKAGKRVEHWKAVAVSACEQSGRSRLPVIYAPLHLAEALDQLDRTQCAVLLDPAGSGTLADSLRTDQPVTLFTGPEGGLTDAEVASAKEAGFEAVALGNRIMRTETAPVVALGLVQYLVGDLGDAG